MNKPLTYQLEYTKKNSTFTLFFFNYIAWLGEGIEFYRNVAKNGHNDSQSMANLFLSNEVTSPSWLPDEIIYRLPLMY